MTSRLIQKVRKNPDFVAATRLLDELGLDYALEPPTGKGHPILRIGSVRWPVASSPRSRMRTANVRAHLRRRLREAGLIPARPSET